MLQAALLAGAPLPFAEGQGEGREEGMAAELVAKKSKVGISYTSKGPLTHHLSSRAFGSSH